MSFVPSRLILGPKIGRWDIHPSLPLRVLKDSDMQFTLAKVYARAIDYCGSMIGFPCHFGSRAWRGARGGTHSFLWNCTLRQYVATERSISILDEVSMCFEGVQYVAGEFARKDVLR